ncbi:MAG: divergent PAP2 family protein [Patescibacteria group bacterium]|nr:divergent PAP2 family protein [Patescibacteria group bacterium]
MSNYIILLTPFIAAAVAQALKISLSKRNKMKIRDFFAFTYAGMPSGHSAFVVSLVVIMGLVEGLDSPLFALSIAFAVIVINDALKLRMYLGQQGETINILVEDLDEDQFLDQKYPKMKERIGHTKREVLAGSCLGIAIAIIIYFLF